MPKRTKAKDINTSQIGEMDNPERLKYFKVIDQLREYGVNEDLPLPQVSIKARVRREIVGMIAR